MSSGPQASTLDVVSQQASASPPPARVRAGGRANGPDRDDGLAGRGKVEKEVQQVQALPLDPAATLCRPARSVRGPSRRGCGVGVGLSARRNGVPQIEQWECHQNQWKNGCE